MHYCHQPLNRGMICQSLAGVAQLDRAPVSGTEGQRFEPSHPHSIFIAFTIFLKADSDSSINIINHKIIRYEFSVILQRETDRLRMTDPHQVNTNQS